jgi:hypothetical protein
MLACKYCRLKRGESASIGVTNTRECRTGVSSTVSTETSIAHARWKPFDGCPTPRKRWLKSESQRGPQPHDSLSAGLTIPRNLRYWPPGLLLLDGGGLPIGIERGQHGAATIGQGANAPKLYPGNLAGSLLECLPQSLPESLSQSLPQSLTRTLARSHDPAHQTGMYVSVHRVQRFPGPGRRADMLRSATWWKPSLLDRAAKSASAGTANICR